MTFQQICDVQTARMQWIDAPRGARKSAKEGKREKDGGREGSLELRPAVIKRNSALQKERERERLVLCRILKIRNHESRFLLPLSEWRICESKNDTFTILLANDSGINSRKKTKNSQGIRIAFLLESESTQP